VASQRQALIRAAKTSKSLNERAAAAREELWHAMAEARRAGMTLQEIADIAGLSRQRVMAILKS
jgi:DNA-directed RNA polymerase sigma subunit (sigma70/sigma32)